MSGFCSTKSLKNFKIPEMTETDVFEHKISSFSFNVLNTLMCLILGTPKIINFPFETNGNGWLTCDFTSFSTVFQSYQDDGQMIMTGFVQ